MKFFTPLIILAILPIISMGQDKINIPQLPEKDGEVFYEEIINVEGKKEDLYSRAKKALIDYFPKNAIDSFDPEEGRLISKQKSIIPIKLGIISHSLQLSFNVQVDCKENKYRYRIYDLQILTVLAAGREDVNGTTKNKQALGIAESTYKTKVHIAQITAIQKEMEILTQYIKNSMKKVDNF